MWFDHLLVHVTEKVIIYINIKTGKEYSIAEDGALHIKSIERRHPTRAALCDEMRRRNAIRVRTLRLGQDVELLILGCM
jgi:hypothetical protein